MEEDYFEKYTQELDKLYQHDPARAVKILSSSVERLRGEKNVLITLTENHEKYDTLFSIIIMILIVPISLVCCKDYGMLFGGLVFFAAGLMSSLSYPYVGLFTFLLHGLIGFFLMNKDVFNIIIESPIMSDFPESMVPYFAILLLTLGSAIILTILHSIFSKIRDIKYIKTIIMFLFLLGLVLLRLAPYKLGIVDKLLFM
jgi:hypothetical protein